MSAPEYIWVHQDGDLIQLGPGCMPERWTRYRLVPAPEPLKWEGRCTWSPASPGGALFPHSISGERPFNFPDNKFYEFNGKKTRITIEEIP
jgi:hypothetical protein